MHFNIHTLFSRFSSSSHQAFWRENPALLVGLSLTWGASSFLFWQTPWNYIFILLWSIYLLFLRKTTFILIIAFSFCYSWMLYGKAPILTSAVQTTALFSIDSLQAHHSPFQKGLVYKGTIYLKEGAFPCSIYYRGKEPPKAVHDYVVQGKLQQRGPYDYIFAPKKWKGKEKSRSLAQVRYETKEAVRKFLHKKLSSRSAKFLGSLITGDVEDRQLRYEFGRLGLQHILAVSGFHFGILIAFCAFILNFFLPRFWKYIVLMIAIHIYFFFIGPLPAVARSWFAAELYLTAKLLKRQPTGLNLLGCAMALEVCFNPLICGNIGFQLSFLSCGGILLFHSFFEKKLRSYLPKRNAEEIGELNYLSKHAYFFSCFLRQSISLTLAVNCFIGPLLLYHFHQFPLLGLFYNLFFPSFVGVVLSLLLLSLSSQLFFTPLSSYLFSLTDWTTTHLLDLASHPPSKLDYSILMSHLPVWSIPLYLFLLFCLSLRVKEPLLIDE